MGQLCRSEGHRKRRFFAERECSRGRSEFQKRPIFLSPGDIAAMMERVVSRGHTVFRQRPIFHCASAVLLPMICAEPHKVNAGGTLRVFCKGMGES